MLNTSILTRIILIIALGVLCVSILVLIQGGFSNSKNGFTRHFVTNDLSKLSFIKNTLNVSQVIGKIHDTIYYKTEKANVIGFTSPADQSIKTLTLNIPNNSPQLFYSFIDDENIYFSSGNEGLIYSFDRLTGRTLNNKIKLPVLTRLVFIPPYSFYARGVDKYSKKPNQIFFKVNFYSGLIKQENDLSEKPMMQE